MSRPAGPMRRANLGSWAGMWLDGLGYQNTRDSLRKHVDEEGKPPSQFATLVLTTKSGGPRQRAGSAALWFYPRNCHRQKTSWNRAKTGRLRHEKFGGFKKFLYLFRVNGSVRFEFTSSSSRDQYWAGVSIRSLTLRAWTGRIKPRERAAFPCRRFVFGNISVENFFVCELFIIFAQS